MKMEKNNLYITNLCVGHKSIYFETPEMPDRTIRDDINELLEEKYATKINMENDNFYEETQLTDENLIDLLEFD